MLISVECPCTWSPQTPWNYRAESCKSHLHHLEKSSIRIIPLANFFLGLSKWCKTLCTRGFAWAQKFASFRQILTIDGIVQRARANDVPGQREIETKREVMTYIYAYDRLRRTSYFFKLAHA